MEMNPHKKQTDAAREAHIAVDARLAFYADAGIYMRSVIKELAKLNPGWKWSLMGKPDELKPFAPENSQIIDFTSPFFTINEQLNYFKSIPNCDLFWSMDINIPYFKKNAKKTLLTIYECPSMHKQCIKNNLQKFLLTKAAPKYDRIVVASEYARNMVNAKLHIPNDRIAIIKPGADRLSYYVNNSIAPYNKKNFIVAFGGANVEETLRTALEAFNRIKNRTTAFVFIIDRMDTFLHVSGSMKHLLKELGGRVQLTGLIPDSEVSALYSHASLYVSSFSYEMSARNALEAMYHSTPVLVPDTAAFSEIGGDVVEYYINGDINDLATKMLNYLNGTYVVDEEALCNFASKYTWDRAIREHDLLIKNILTT